MAYGGFPYSPSPWGYPAAYPGSPASYGTYGAGTGIWIAIIIILFILLFIFGAWWWFTCFY
ncbi:hypothetical protein HPT25_00155 [Bacillus sp. BRMEA1]|uniref:hypothetical protein n=1 Tax=Neobacillus endophyticus TaxID=2738405 RepID=UPI001567312C|nr:hypothetical protein [Neobacillus endophyticus]NRD75918.1 hypothetical protein [Neobacillus endophyticus]